MGTKQKLHKVDLTIVGGQPAKTRQIPGAGDMEVPVGFVMLLYLAARDGAFRQQLLDDRDAAIAAAGVALRDSELATLRAVSDAALDHMIDSLAAENPWGRRLMRKVASAAASLAAGTAIGTVAVDCTSTHVAGTEPASEVDSFTTTTDTSMIGGGGAGAAAGPGGGTGGQGSAGGQGGSGSGN